ncbi:MAG: LamG-like jellyroll fold domain-containing protein, partial [Chitinophagaceae bacterium]
MLKLFKGLVIYLVFTVVAFFCISTLKAQTVYSHTFTSGSVSGSNYNQTPDLIAANLSVGSPQWTSSGTTALTSCSGNQNLAVSVPTAGSSRSLTLTLNVAPGYTFNLTNVSAKLISGINNGGLGISVNGNSASNTLNFVNTCTGELSSFNTAQSFTGTVTFVITATNSGTNGTQNIAVDDFVLTGTVTLNSLNNLGISNLLAQSAYSLRKLRDTYTGAAIEVRRSSDNTTQNIAFTAAGNLDTTALKTFVGGSNGFVTIWYDQSGNARNLTQTTASKQPTIVNAGVIFRKSTLPTIFFDATDDGMLFTGADYLITNGFTVNLVAGSNSASASARRAVQGVNGINNNWLIGPYQNTHTWFAGGFNHQAATPWLTSQVERFTVIQATSVANTSFRNGTSITSANNKSIVPGKLYLGTEGGFAEFLDGFISELVSYSTELNTTDRQSMETSQATYYPISTNANLSTLITTPTTTLTPAFTANTIAYTTTVANSTTTITVTPTREQANASIEVRVNGGAYAAVTSGSASGNLSLNVGTNTIDVRVTAQDGTTIKTYTITVTRAANPPGNALNFDGTNDRVTATVTNMPLGNSSRTFELWLRTTTTGTFIAAGNSRNNNFFGLTVLSNSLYLAGWQNDFQFNTNLIDGKWHHIAATHDGTTARLYVDGSLIGSSARTYNTIGNDLVLGTFFNLDAGTYPANTYSQHFGGSIDEVRIWNTARTQSEI